MIPALLCTLQAHELFAQNFGEMIRSSEPLTPEEELQTFKVPDGFEVQLFAAEPDIQKPMNLAFDARGRLWVSGSNDYPFPNLTNSATDSIRILEDTNGDGKADRFTTFVEGITIPIGLYPYQDGVIAFSIPNITFYRDTDGDGKSDEAKVLYGPFDYSRDTHGLNNAFRRGLDGWMYACHGFNNRSKVAGADGNTVSMQSGNTYRFKLDGSRIEHFTHGQVNPFGMAFDHLGDAYTSDCHTKPVTLLIQDGFYPSFGKPHDGLGFVPAVMEHLHGSTAIAGLSQFTGGGFPGEYENNLFIGNVMTSRVHRDSIQYAGSTAKVVEQPDFLSSTDSWFRPVDTQCGPDQALYVADFYNRIIGHYEVPLDHPGRDRHRARIWRVRYVGDQKSGKQAPQDLTQLSAEELVHQLSVPSLPYDYRIVEQLVERIGEECLPVVRKGLNESSTELQHAYLLWVRHRLNDLSIEELTKEFENDSEIVRIHIQRILNNHSNWSEGHFQLARSGLKSSPLVQRVTATALSQHARFEEIPHLVQACNAAADDDVHLKHTCKIAIRNSLQTPAAYDFISKRNWTQDEEDLLVQISIAVKSKDAANYLLSRIDESGVSSGDLERIVSIAAQHLDLEQLPRLVTLSKSRFRDDIDLQLELLVSILNGLKQQGRSPNTELIDWARELVEQVVRHPDKSWEDWNSVGLGGKSSIVWDIEPRNTASGKKDVPFISSLPAGERAIGILRSKTFVIPEKLSFDVCGHLGFPNDQASPKNFVSIHTLTDSKPLKLALAPRHDTAQRVTWDLSEFAGQKGYLQVTDGLDIRAYAWIAMSGVSPPVVRVPKMNLNQYQNRLEIAANLSAQLKLEEFRSEWRSIAEDESASNEVRFSALKTQIHEETPVEFMGMMTIVWMKGLNKFQRGQLIQVVLEQDQQRFIDTLKTFPLSVQTEFARSLSLDQTGSQRLIELITAGSISPFVLSSSVVTVQIENLKNPVLVEQFKMIREKLPRPDQKIQKMISQRKKEYEMKEASLSVGKVVFQKNCAACHSIQGEGKKIGPQLDGIGNRGLDRVLEDVLAPNRNIDVAFRSRTYLLESGKIHSGLFRRKEGELTVIANSKGEEVSFLTGDVEAEKVSNLSIMPENWGELIKEDEFRDLLGYLLSQRQK